MATIVILIVLLFLVAMFSVQNAAPVAITFLFWRFDASLAIVVFLSVVCGTITGAIIASLLRFKSSSKKEEKTVERPKI
jgi:uncharacterized integral membrane protein